MPLPVNERLYDGFGKQNRSHISEVQVLQISGVPLVTDSHFEFRLPFKIKNGGANISFPSPIADGFWRMSFNQLFKSTSITGLLLSPSPEFLWRATMSANYGILRAGGLVQVPRTPLIAGAELSWLRGKSDITSDGVCLVRV
jgi:hypothetical protein